MVAGKKPQLEIATDASGPLSSSHGASSSPRLSELLVTKCREFSSSATPPSMDVMDIHTSPSCRTSRVLSSKRTPKAAAQPDPELSSEPLSKHDFLAKQQFTVKDGSKSPQFPTKQAEPEGAVAQRRRSSGHIIVGAQRPQLYLSPKSDPGSNSKPVVGELKASAAKDPHAPVLSIQILRPARGLSSDAIQIMIALNIDLSAGFQANVAPIPVDDCTGGVYYLRSKTRRIVAVFKPSDEEPYAPNNPKQYVHHHPQKSKLDFKVASHPEDCSESSLSTSGVESSDVGIRAGIAAGDAAVREVAAFLLDKNQAAGVPITVLARASHPAFHYAASLPSSRQQERKSKTGALQVYVPHKCTADDLSSSLFSVADVHTIALLDIRLANQDRHGGNILVVEPSKRVFKLVPIDHGACLPRIADMEETSFLWLSWPQAKRPFSEDMLQYIASLDPFEEIRMLQQALPQTHQLEEQALLTLLVCTVFLQVCALEKSMSAYDIGMLMCRHGSFCQQQPAPSALELLVAKTLDDCAAGSSCRRPRGSQLDPERYFKAVVQSFRDHLATFLSTWKQQ